MDTETSTGCGSCPRLAHRLPAGRYLRETADRVACIIPGRECSSSRATPATRMRPIPLGCSTTRVCRQKSQPKPTMTKRWRCAPDVAWAGTSDRVVLAHTTAFDPSGPRILTGIAAWIWIMLPERSTLDDLTRSVEGEFGAPPADCGVSVGSIVHALTNLGFLEEF